MCRGRVSLLRDGRAMLGSMNCSDVLVVGGGPAGTALAAELAALGLAVQQLAPHDPRPFPATYGAWLDDLPASVRDCIQTVWTDVRVYTGAAPTPLLRPYALLDNTALLRRLRRQGVGLMYFDPQAQR